MMKNNQENLKVSVGILPVNGVIQVACLCPSVDTALAAIKQTYSFIACFLDIDMPEKKWF
jgi:hypothetical protein